MEVQSMPVRGEDEHHEPPEQVSAQGDGEKWGRPVGSGRTRPCPPSRRARGWRRVKTSELTRSRAQVVDQQWKRNSRSPARRRGQSCRRGAARIPRRDDKGCYAHPCQVPDVTAAICSTPPRQNHQRGQPDRTEQEVTLIGVGSSDRRSHRRRPSGIHLANEVGWSGADYPGQKDGKRNNLVCLARLTKYPWRNHRQGESYRRPNQAVPEKKREQYGGRHEHDLAMAQ